MVPSFFSAVWWHFVAVIICMGAPAARVLGELSSWWLFETDGGMFLSHSIFGAGFHSLAVKQSTI